MNLLDDICKEANLHVDGVVYISAIVASQLLARTMFFAPNREARARLKEGMEAKVSGTLENACRHLNQIENEASGMAKPN